MTPEEALSRIESLDAEILLLEPRSSLDRCLVGVVQRFNSYFALYSMSCVLAEFARDMPDDDPDFPPDLAAREYFEFNTIGAWMGEGTPAFMLDEEEM